MLGDPSNHSYTNTTKEGMCFCSKLPNIWVLCFNIMNRREQRHLCQVVLRQAGNAILRTALNVQCLNQSKQGDRLVSKDNGKPSHIKLTGLISILFWLDMLFTRQLQLPCSSSVFSGPTLTSVLSVHDESDSNNWATDKTRQPWLLGWNIHMTQIFSELITKPYEFDKSGKQKLTWHFGDRKH